MLANVQGASLLIKKARGPGSRWLLTPRPPKKNVHARPQKGAARESSSWFCNISVYLELHLFRNACYTTSSTNRVSINSNKTWLMLNHRRRQRQSNSILLLNSTLEVITVRALFSKYANVKRNTGSETSASAVTIWETGGEGGGRRTANRPCSVVRRWNRTADDTRRGFSLHLLHRRFLVVSPFTISGWTWIRLNDDGCSRTSLASRGALLPAAMLD